MRWAVALLPLLLGCQAGQNLRRCTGLTWLRSTPGSVARAATHQPSGPLLSCFRRESERDRCAEQDIETLPSRAELASAEHVCWVSIFGEGLCARENLDRLLSECEIEDLSLVVPWNRTCERAIDELRSIAQDPTTLVVPSGATARTLLFADASRVRPLSNSARMSLVQVSDGAPVLNAEAHLAFAVQRCQGWVSNPWVGEVTVELIEDLVWDR